MLDLWKSGWPAHAGTYLPGYGPWIGDLLYGPVIFPWLTKTQTTEIFLEVFPEILTEYAVQDRVSRRVHIRHNYTEYTIRKCDLKRCLCKCVVENQDLGRSVADDIHQYTRCQHLHHIFPRFYRVWCFVLFQTSPGPHLEPGMKVLRTGVQLVPNDSIQYNLKYYISLI